MRRTGREALLLIAALLLPLACVLTEPFRTVPSPTTSHTPLAEGTPQAVVSRGSTDAQGKAIVIDSQGSDRAIVHVEDEDSGLPVPGVEVYFMRRGSRYLALAVDPEGKYLASWSEGSIDEPNTTSSPLDTFDSVFLPRPAYAQTLPIVWVFLKAVSTVSSFQDLIAYLQDPPDLVYWGVLYEETCWTGQQLANFVGSSGLVLSAVGMVAGIPPTEMDYITRSIFALSQHVMEEDAKAYLLGLDRRVRIRTYHLGIPVLGMVPVGWCEPERTPTVPEATSTPTVPPVPPEDTPVAPPTSCGFGWNRPIVYPCLFSGTHGEICALCPDGSRPIRLTTSGPDTIKFYPSWSPDGQWIAFRQDTAYSEEDSGIFVMRRDGSELTQLTSSYEDAYLLSWSPDGQWIAFERSGAGRSPPGRIFIVRRDGSELTQLTFDGNNWNPSWSRDGQWVVFGRSYQDAYGIFIMRPDGSQLTQLTELAHRQWAFWSPDGQWIAFWGWTSGARGEIFVMRPDGSEQTQLTFDREISLWQAPEIAWSPDGQRIVFPCCWEDDDEIFVVGRDGSELTQLTFNEVRDSQPIWSPDGQWIAYQSRGEIFIMRPDGSEQTLLGSGLLGDFDW